MARVPIGTTEWGDDLNADLDSIEQQIVSHKGQVGAANPHGLAPADIGAATQADFDALTPASIGALDRQGSKYSGHLDDALDPGFYRINGADISTANGFPYVDPNSVMYLKVDRYVFDTYGIQMLWNFDGSMVWSRALYGAAWKAWERIDAGSVTPVSLGVPSLSPDAPSTGAYALTQAQATYTGHADDMPTGGWYVAGASATDGWPIDGQHSNILCYSAYTYNRRVQILTTLYYGEMWTRAQHPGTGAWQPWRAVGPISRSVTGSPEGILAAPIGTEYVDRGAANGARKWYKASGTGNTGWIVTDGDTGMRTVAAWDSTGAMLVGSLPPGWRPMAGYSGSVKVRRIDRQVTAFLSKVEVAVATTSDAIWTAPVGFRPNDLQDYLIALYKSANSYRAYAFLANLTRGSGAVSEVGEYIDRATISYVTNDPWPTTLPGNPA